MPFTLRPHRRFPVQCVVPYHADPFRTRPLAYCVSFWILITLLLLSGGPACAEWVGLGYAEDATVYVDPDTIRREGDLAKMWVLWDYKTIKIGKDFSYLSSQWLEQYDCVEPRGQPLASTYFSGNMGNGNRVFNETGGGGWWPVPPRSIAQNLWKVACNKQ